MHLPSPWIAALDFLRQNESSSSVPGSTFICKTQQSNDFNNPIQPIDSRDSNRLEVCLHTAQIQSIQSSLLFMPESIKQCSHVCMSGPQMPISVKQIA